MWRVLVLMLIKLGSRDAVVVDVKFNRLESGMSNLKSFARNVYSQNGEDGIIEEVLRRLRLPDHRDFWCVEFGAWDGKHLSNTFNLVNGGNWNAVYIEGDETKYEDLLETAALHSKIHPILAHVGGTHWPGASLDALLSNTPLPLDYDLLSIDIDSHDLDVWVDHVLYSPKIVVLEINSRFPPGELKWCTDMESGCSFSSAVSVARDRGYSLICHTGNLIFVRDEFAHLLGMNALDLQYPERLFSWDWVPKRSREGRGIRLREVRRWARSKERVPSNAAPQTR